MVANYITHIETTKIDLFLSNIATELKGNIELDILAKDQHGNLFNIEIQMSRRAKVERPQYGTFAGLINNQNRVDSC